MGSVLLLIGTVLLLAAGARRAGAQSPQFVPAYPLYCHGPLTTGAPSSGETMTPFIWAAASKHGNRPGLRAAPAPLLFDVLVANSREQFASCIRLPAGGQGIQNQQP
jgi:hypothetical protein